MAATQTEEAAERGVSLEALAYIALALLAFCLRLAELDAVNMTDREAQLSLQAWHTVEDDAPGSFDVSSSPLTYNTQLLAYSLLGASEFTARIGPALAGLATVFAPLLFRGVLGRTRTFVWSTLLALLTLPIASSRSVDGAAFMILFALLSVWMIRRYWYSQQPRDALWAIVPVTFMVGLSSPSGIPLLIVMMLSGWLAVWRTAMSAPQRLELTGDDILQLAVKRLGDFPFAHALLIPLLVILPTATFFMLNRAGLSTVSQLIETAIAGVGRSFSYDGAPLGLAALAAYEPLLIIFACGGAWLLWKKGDVTYVDRFAAAWAAVGAVSLLLYPGAGPADAMWVVAPLTLLASYGITQLMVNRRVVVLWAPAEDADEGGQRSELYTTRFWWAKWAISAGILLCLLILSVQYMQVARLMLNLPPTVDWAEALSKLTEPTYLRLLQGLGLLMITAIITLIVFAMVANFWGLGTCLQGIGLGFMWLLLFSGLGGAWQIAVADAASPNGLWRQSAAADDAYLLRETLFELADRASEGFPLLDLNIVTDDEGIIVQDGLVAWLLRDFPNARFLPSADLAAGAPIVIMADQDDMSAAPAGNYVGQRFVLRRKWSIAQLTLWDIPAWWTQSRLRDGALREEAAILWLRQDVYDGIPAPLRADK